MRACARAECSRRSVGTLSALGSVPLRIFPLWHIRGRGCSVPLPKASQVWDYYRVAGDATCDIADSFGRCHKPRCHTQSQTTPMSQATLGSHTIPSYAREGRHPRVAMDLGKCGALGLLAAVRRPPGARGATLTTRSRAHERASIAHIRCHSHACVRHMRSSGHQSHPHAGARTAQPPHPNHPHACVSTMVQRAPS